MAFDLNTAGQKCWMFTNQEKANNTQSHGWANHYKRVKNDSAECDGENFQLNNLKFEIRCIQNTQYLYKAKLDICNGCTLAGKLALLLLIYNPALHI